MEVFFGKGIGEGTLIELLSKFRQMYEITGVSMKYCEFLLNNYNLVETYIKKVKEEKQKVLTLMKKFSILDSESNWIHFNTHDDNLKTKQILDKHKVLVKYCKLPHDTKTSWCRMTIQPDMTSRPFFRELVNEQ